MVSFSDFEAFFIPIVTTVIGIILAMIVKTLHDEGRVLDEFIVGSITITDVMTCIVVLFFVIGIIIAAVKR